MTAVPVRDCPTISETFEREEILATIRTFFERYSDFCPTMSDEQVFVYAFAKYECSHPTDIMTRARGEGDYKRWMDNNVLPCYMGSWFNAATEGQ